MNLNQRCDAFTELGSSLRKNAAAFERGEETELGQLILSQQYKNQWFTPRNVLASISAIAEELTADNLKKWMSMYPGIEKNTAQYTAGVIMAGNIPLVGFHDFLCVLITGNRLLAKKSSKDPDLISGISEILCRIEPGFREMINFSDGPLSGFDAIIATGSNNTSRYFESYFGKYPNIIRKNRNSVAIISGNETDDELKALGGDIFSYYGLGCRNVSKLFIPEGFDPRDLIRHLDSYSYVTENNKYCNNYDYYKAIYLVNREPFLDTGYLLMKEDPMTASPVAVTFYSYYKSYDVLLQEIKTIENSIQCIVSKNHLPFGQAQKPALWDYSDGIDTIEFLLKKIHI